MSTLGVYAKAVAAFIATTLGAVGSWMIVVLTDAHISGVEWGGLLIAVGGVVGATIGVAAVTNAKDDRGAGDATLILLVAAVVGVVLLLFGVRFD